MNVSLFAVSIDCADAARLAGFWAHVLDRPVDTGASQEFAVIGMESPDAGAGPVWMFHQVPEPKKAKNRLHLDFVAPGLSDEVQRIVALGASHLGDVDENGYQWATLADPEGNEFDVVAAPAG
jgi:predicted enzyme related to lactoylglutathione lyase